MSMLDIKLHEVSKLLYRKIDDLLPDESDYGGSRLIEAMRYSALSPGKRLRPFLTVATANLFGVSENSALQTAAAIELIHTYSLIHDDLPAMDDDDVRRGQPSCHVKFDEATAILAGDALLTYAFEIIADPSTHSSANVRCESIKCVSKAAGHRGMVGGQMMDMDSENTDISINQITHLQRLKTGELFAVSCETGAILGNAAGNLRNIMRGYAHDIGLAFQITDDLLDVEAVNDNSSERADKSAGKPTFVTSIGAGKAREQAKILCNQAISHLSVFGKKADVLRDLARHIVNRTS